jgi:predicted RNase H-like HicB family nuclease
MGTFLYYAAFVPDVDGNVAVWFPDVPGCVARGENTEHAFAQAMAALKTHLEELADAGGAIPAPSQHEAACARMRSEFVQRGEAVPQGTVMHIVPAPALLERIVRVNVSFRKSVLSMIDSRAAAAGMNRSGFLAKAVEAYCAE